MRFYAEKKRAPEMLMNKIIIPLQDTLENSSIHEASLKVDDRNNLIVIAYFLTQSRPVEPLGNARGLTVLF